jgi:hypothetical protein
MAKIYSEEKIIKELDESFLRIDSRNEIKQDNVEGFKSSLSYILSYSKSLSVKSSENIGSVYLNMN